jgi:hypothetical protein
MALGLCAWSGAAQAQDFGVGPQREPTLTTSRLGLETSWAQFDLYGVRGQYIGLTARLDVKLHRHVGMRLLVPTYIIQQDNQPAGNGFGDSELRVRVLLLDAHDWRFYGGLADQLPTGNTALGLGQGGTQLSPFITGGWRKGPVVVFGSVADCIGLHPEDKGLAHTSDYVDPSNDHELRATFGAIAEIGEPVYVSAVVTDVTDLDPGSAGTSLLIGGAALGYLVSDDFKVVMVGQMPLAGEHRFEDKIGLNAYLYF